MLKTTSFNLKPGWKEWRKRKLYYFRFSQLEQIKSSEKEWTDLLRKEPEAKREDAEKAYQAFQLKEKLLEWYIEGNTKLVELNDLIQKLRTTTKQYQRKAEKERKEEEIGHARELAQLNAPAQHAAAPKSNMLPTVYQLPTIQYQKFSGNKLDWQMF